MVIVSKNKHLVQQCGFQKIWKVLLSIELPIPEKNFGKIDVLLNVIIQELKFSKIAQLFLVCQILSWEKIWEDREKVSNTKSEP